MESCDPVGGAPTPPPIPPSPPPYAPPYTPPPPAAASNRTGDRLLGCGLGCLASLAMVFVAPLLLCLCIGSCASSFQSSLEDGIDKAMGRAKPGVDEEGGVDDCPSFTEVWSTGVVDGDKFVRIPIRGLIDLSEKTDRLFGLESGSAAFALDAIHAATRDVEVRGLLLEIDSPGGGVTDSDILYNALMAFKAEHEGRVVVVLMGDLCASGGYYIASAADYIMAHPTTTLGSIGVIIPGFNLKGLADRLGIREDPIVSGPNKSMGGLLGERTEEQRAILQEVVDASYDRFVSLVAKGRGLDEASVKALADGRIFSAARAKELKLVDGIGYYDDAVRELCRLAEAEEAYMIRYEDGGALGGFHLFRKHFGSLSSGLFPGDFAWRPKYLIGK